jgi:hypothetical protein
VLAVRGAVLGEGRPAGRQAAGGDGAGEDEALHAELAGEVERVPEAFDVGPPVLGVLLAGEVVVRREVDDRVRAAEDPDHPEDLAERLALSDVDLEPGDVRVDRSPAAVLRPARDAEDPVVAGDGLEEVSTDEAGRPGQDERGQVIGAQGPTRRREPSTRAGRIASGFGGGPSFGRPSASNFPSWQGQT